MRGMISVIELPRRVDDDLAADIEKEAAFVSPHLSRLRVRPAGDAVELEISGQAAGAEVEAKVGRFLNAMLKRTHRFEPKIFLRYERRDDGPMASGVHAELERRGWLFAYGRSHVALLGPALALAEAIDARAAALYRQHFQALPASFPAFVDARTLHRCGYFDSHPNAVSFVGHIVEDFDAIEAFRQANSCAEGAPHLPDADHVHMPGLCLNPAACFPCYPTLEGREIDSAGQAFTWRGRVFRYESRNLAGLDRLWEFNVREIVFIGSDAHVADCRHRAIPLIGELAATFDLTCQIETAADPFFATVSAARTFWQRAQEVKNEIMLAIEPRADGTPRRLACGSINLHGRYFGDRFAIAASGQERAASGCIGLGIERWVLAAFSQHGFEPERWPAAVRGEIFA
jgi:seryl-tRNA synthetase